MARQSVTPFGFGLPTTGGADPFLTLHREMNRLFDSALRGGLAPGQEAQEGGGMLMPRIDVSETENALRITAELPGVTEKDLDVTLQDDLLTIRGEKKFERKQERQDFHFTERSYGTFQRSLRLPFQADPEQVQASFENGVLTVTVPKAQLRESKRRIQVQAGSGASQGSQPETGAGGGTPAS
ncbi:MAG: Hsp20/alpha crystallin family protein [Acidisphaera sp.]|nr:Hsp20/alpha crystallin family protein [Acidisphaera sp.]